MKTSNYNDKYVSEASQDSGSYSKPKKIIIERQYFSSNPYPYVQEELSSFIQSNFPVEGKDALAEGGEKSYDCDETKYVKKLK